MRIGWGYGYIDLLKRQGKGVLTMATRQQYLKDGVKYALVSNAALDDTTPYWVFVGDKLAYKFACKRSAKEYILVLMRY